MKKYIYGCLNLHTIENPQDFLSNLYKIGIRQFETARIYGKGESEKILGSWLKSLTNEKQNEIKIITKGGCYGPEAKWKPNLKGNFITSQLFISLNYLSKIDLFLLHRDDPNISISKITKMMDYFVKNNYISNWGVSNWTHKRLQEAINYCKENNLIKPIFSSIQYSILKPPKDKLWPGTVHMNLDEYQWYKKTKFPVLCWEVLAKGFILDTRKKSIYNTDKNIEKIKKLNNLSILRNIPINNLAINYVLSENINSSVIIGSTNLDHIKENIKYLSKIICKDELNYLN